VDQQKLTIRPDWGADEVGTYTFDGPSGGNEVWLTAKKGGAHFSVCMTLSEAQELAANIGACIRGKLAGVAS
jgi:frataxin-like iron-binding protein CyaY